MRWKVSAWFWYLSAISLAAFLMSILVSTFGVKNQVEETVAIDSKRHTSAPAATPIVTKSELLPQEREVEIVGDRIAETGLYLKKRQTGAALKALRQAELATNHALAMRPQNGIGNKDLVTTLSDIESAERAIQRGNLDDAARQLNAIERKLDAIAR